MLLVAQVVRRVERQSHQLLRGYVFNWLHVTKDNYTYTQEQ